jgi:hypothetical protein
MIWGVLFYLLASSQSYDLPAYGCAVRQLNTYSRCVYIPGYLDINFFGAKCVTYNVDSNCMCVGDGTQCYPSSTCVLHEEECFWDWRGGQEECEKTNGPINRLKCSRDEWIEPLNDPGQCVVRKVSQPKCKVNIRPIYYDPYEIYECITEKYEANCTYTTYTQGSYECVPTENVRKYSSICQGCFRDKEDLLNRCERDGIPNDDVYICSDNQVNVMSDVIQEEKENITEGISQRNGMDCISSSSYKIYPFILNIIFIILIFS